MEGPSKNWKRYLKRENAIRGIMVSKLQDLIIKKFLAVWLKTKLDATGRGWKTVLGVLMVILDVLVRVYPVGPFAPIASILMTLITELGFDPLLTAGASTAVVGAVHKIAVTTEKVLIEKGEFPDGRAGGWDQFTH